MTLDSIPKAIKDKVVKCAKERKNMLFVGGKESQGKALANYAHESVNKLRCKECFIIDYRLYGNRQEFLDDIKIIQCRGFFLNDLLNVEKNKIIQEGGVPLPGRDSCPPPSNDEDEILINTLFIKNLNLLAPDEDLIRGAFGLSLTKPVNNFKPLIIIHSDKPFPDLLKKEYGFEDIKVKSKHINDKKGSLTKEGRPHNIPEDKLWPFIKEEYEYCKEEEKNGNEKWPVTKISLGLERKIKARFEDDYGDKAKFKPRSIGNIILRMKKKKFII